MCQFLIEAKADVNAKDIMCTPLHRALENGTVPIEFLFHFRMI